MKTAWFVLAALSMPMAAWAHSERPLPVIKSSSPAKIFPGQMTLDAMGQIDVTFYGQNLGPADGDNNHSAGWEGGYQHIQIRGVSPTGALGAWVDCHSSDCRPRGSTGVDGTELYLGLAPRILTQPGGGLQVRVWVSVSPIENMDPEASTVPSSEWSQPYTLPIAKPGDKPPVTVTATVVTSSSSSSAASSSSAPAMVKKAIVINAPHPNQGSSSSSSSSSATTQKGALKPLQTHTPDH